MLIHKLQQYANFKNIIILGSALLLVYSFMVTFTIILLHYYSGNFHDYIFNVRIFYTPAMLYHSLRLLGAHLRYLYLVIAVIDVGVALLYGGFGVLLTYKIISSITKKICYLRFSYLFLVAAMINIVEDVCLSIIFVAYPTQFIVLASIASMLTFIKLFCLALGLIIVAVSLLMVTVHGAY